MDIYTCHGCETEFVGPHYTEQVIRGKTPNRELVDERPFCRGCKPVKGVRPEADYDDLLARTKAGTLHPGHGKHALRAMARAHYAGELRQGIIDNRPTPHARRAYYGAGGR